MGMFDSVIVKCPNCGEELEFQSKVGECILSTYQKTSVPLNIAKDLYREQQVCPSCGEMSMIYGLTESRVELLVTNINPENSIKKIIEGTVIQEFDPNTNKCISQGFIAGDVSKYEVPDGCEVETSELAYQPFDMVQPG